MTSDINFSLDEIILGLIWIKENHYHLERIFNLHRWHRFTYIVLKILMDIKYKARKKDME